ncbi:MAG: peroxiredoxin [Thermoplasmata archaeon]
MIAVGEKGPDFDAPVAGGGRLRLSTLRGAPVVLYFYPAADTPGCTIESKGFRDVYPEFRAKNVHVVGVSVDEVEDQEKFAGKYQLPFPLVSDTSKAVSESYGTLGGGGRSRRVTFLMDPGGKVLEVVDDRDAEKHVKRARERFLTSSK